MTVAELKAARAKHLDAMHALANLPDLDDKQLAEYKGFKVEIEKISGQITRLEEVQAEQAKLATPVGATRVPAAPETDRYLKEKSLQIGGIAKMLGSGGGGIHNARASSIEIYGENHPVTKALFTGSGSAGGFIVPPDVLSEVIELLRAQAVVRSAGPRIMPMTRGTMTLPGQTSPSTASYGEEGTAIVPSQPGLGAIVASFKKLTALVPISNDMMRYADPAIDAFVRDDLVKVMALREDLAFLLGDGTQSTPRGYLSFANGWIGKQGGTVGNWSQSVASTFAVNAADPANTSGGNFITSNPTYVQSTVVAELGGAASRLDTANVSDNRRTWFMNPRTWNYLFNLQNSLGLYVFRDELAKGTLNGYPFKKTTQIPTTYWDATGTNKDLSFIFLVEMVEDLILDSLQMQLAVSMEGTYVNAAGQTISAFQQDQTVIRAIAEHDHQMRHDAAVAVIQGVRWAPTIS